MTDIQNTPYGPRHLSYPDSNMKSSREPEIRRALDKLDNTLSELTSRVDMLLTRLSDLRNQTPKPSSGMPGMQDEPIEVSSTPLGNQLSNYNQRLQNCLIEVTVALADLEI